MRSDRESYKGILRVAFILESQLYLITDLHCVIVWPELCGSGVSVDMGWHFDVGPNEGLG